MSHLLVLAISVQVPDNMHDALKAFPDMTIAIGRDIKPKPLHLRMILPQPIYNS